MSEKCKSMKLSAAALGVSLGLVTGLFMMFFAWAGWMYGYGTTIIEQWGAIYPGFEATLVGGFLGLAWGFLEGFIIGIFWAWFYNMCLCCCRCCSCCSKKEKTCNTN
ncbi:hypothetical protein N9L02_00165 [Gammaproteobacteria bacterium]|nr:hypothetical protein [Gammaproteobacteria bacterium]